MIQRVQAKTDAKAQLKGYWGRAIGAFVLIGLVSLASGVVNMIPFVGWIGSTALASVVVLCMASYSLKFANGNKPDVDEMFSGFENFLKAWGLNLVIGIFTFLWALLFIIPGIIKAISYSMAMYILADNPEIGVMEALNKSKEITTGHKWELFVVYLSFLGWTLLASLTLGIGYLWLVPYMQITYANIYNQIKGGSIGTQIEYEPIIENDLI